MRSGRSALLAAVALAACTGIGTPEAPPPTIKVGILHSLSGTMAISEAALKDVALMAIEEINASGGVLGKKLEPVVVDPASSWSLYAEKMKALLVKEKVAVVFGCWTSVSRKAVLPALHEHNGLLFYPVQYEGEELDRNVFYTGATPNQQAIPAIEYLMSSEGGSVRRFFLLGTDYVYPHTTNRIIRALLNAKGVDDRDIDEAYVPFGQSDYRGVVSRIRAFGVGARTAVISTINGDSNIAFYRDLARARVRASDIPVMAFSIGEEELKRMDPSLLEGHLATWNYFMSIRGPDNQAFVQRYRAYAAQRDLSDARDVVTSDPKEATYVGVHLWARAVEASGSVATDDVIAALGGLSVRAPSGFTLAMDEINHHLHKPVFIGQIKSDGQFKIIWESSDLVRPQPWSPFIAGDPGLEKK